MRQTTRTFIAIPLPGPIGNELEGWQSELFPSVPGYRWVSSPFHLTLAFLGEVRNRDLNELCLAVAEASRPFQPFNLSMEGLGAFPTPRKSRVIWAGVTVPDPNPLHHLYDAVVQALTRTGHRPDDLRFHPHVTLGRIKSSWKGECDLTEIVHRFQHRSSGSFFVTEVVTFSSTLEPSGPTYASLGRASLEDKKTEPSP
jgi:2'-5' RNA ligase